MADDKKTPAAEAPALKDVVKEVSEALLPVIMAATKASQPTPAAVAAKPNMAEECPTCRQRGNACGGRHKKVVVCPDDEDAEQWFQGVKINGINYRSMPGQAIWVPADAHIKAFVQGYVRNERELVRGRKRTRHSGALSPSGSNVRGADPKDYLR